MNVTDSSVLESARLEWKNTSAIRDQSSFRRFRINWREHFAGFQLWTATEFCRFPFGKEFWKNLLSAPAMFSRFVQPAKIFTSFCSTIRTYGAVNLAKSKSYRFLLSSFLFQRHFLFFRWPVLKKQLENCPVQNWFDLYRTRQAMIFVTQNSLDALAGKFIREDIVHISDMAFGPMIEAAIQFELGHLFLIDELRCILNEVPP